MTMTHRGRVLASLEESEQERLPIHPGSSRSTEMVLALECRSGGIESVDKAWVVGQPSDRHSEADWPASVLRHGIPGFGGQRI